MSSPANFVSESIPAWTNKVGSSRQASTPLNVKERRRGGRKIKSKKEKVQEEERARGNKARRKKAEDERKDEKSDGKDRIKEGGKVGGC